MKPLRLGCIADDFTGATDLANNLVKTGFRVIQVNGLPTAPLQQEVEAVVVALKIRNIPAGDACEQALKALAWLRAQGANQIYFKDCSTFDSTPKGNIGPVTDALMNALQTRFTVATPAFPDNGRSIYKGHLFVNDRLLNESGMQNHPLTPMTDPNLVRVLQAQTTRKVGLIDQAVVLRGTSAIETKISELAASGVEVAVVDSIQNQDLIKLGRAVRALPLLTAGSGLAIGLAQNHGLSPSAQASQLPAPKGRRAIVAGSCSQATQGQIAHAIKSGLPTRQLDIAALMRGEDVCASLLDWAAAQFAEHPNACPLVFSSQAAGEIAAWHSRFDPSKLGQAIEDCLATVAKALVHVHGVGQLIVAGGETSGACVTALAIEQMQIGPQIDPGVPWCHAPLQQALIGGATAEGDARIARGLHIALKSGNFGSDDFFTKAFAILNSHG